MSTCSQSYLSEHDTSYIMSETGSGAEALEPKSPDARDLFTHQTGQVLLELGNLFIHIPPFNEHVDRNTGALLISIGNKLQGRK